jgi:hypothetical protein
MKRSLVIATALATFSLAGSALATTWSYTWNRPSGASPTNDGAGLFKSVTTSYNDATKQFTWSASFTAGAGGVLPDAFTLAVNNGPNPKGIAGQLALIYFDASSAGTPKVTVYGYNGQNSFTSWQDGNGVASGNQTPDKIISSTNNAGITASVTNIAGVRTLSLSMNAATVNAFNSAYDTVTDPWEGIKFDQNLGFWYHPLSGADFTYNSAGWITNFNYCSQGWFDTSGLRTVPTPGAAALGLMGSSMFLRRKRTK